MITSPEAESLKPNVDDSVFGSMVVELNATFSERVVSPEIESVTTELRVSSPETGSVEIELRVERGAISPESVGMEMLFTSSEINSVKVEPSVTYSETEPVNVELRVTPSISDEESSVLEISTVLSSLLSDVQVSDESRPTNSVEKVLVEASDSAVSKVLELLPVSELIVLLVSS